PALELGPCGNVLGPDRLLEEQRIVGCKRVAELHRLPWLEDLGVRIEGQLVLARAMLADAAEILRAGAHPLAPARAVHVDTERAELERGEAPFRVELRRLVARDRGIWCGVDAGIDLHAIARVAAEQLIDRHTERLGRDVPQGVVDAGDRREAKRAGRE